VALLGRDTARRRLRRAARESLKIPNFSAPADCGPWVTGGLWPAELSTVNAGTVDMVRHLKADLQRIVEKTNTELEVMRRAGLTEAQRKTQEMRIVNDARAFAQSRVASTVRLLHDGQQSKAQSSSDTRIAGMWTGGAAGW
jgi:hypothetical protein